MKKVAIVTGSRQGIGKGIADLLVENGYQVIYSDVADTMDGVEYIQLDISNASDRERAVAYIRQKYGRLDLLVNNAGIACKTRLDILETNEESFDRLIRVNTKGMFFMCQAFAKYMIECIGEKTDNDYHPRIVNITSNSSYTSSVSRGEYCISKAGAAMVTTLFADRLGEYDIPVIEIRPGIIQTPMTEVVTAKYDKLISEGITPVKRWGQPEDVAKAVLSVAMGLLDFSTGTAINVDGGFHIKRL